MKQELHGNSFCMWEVRELKAAKTGQEKKRLQLLEVIVTGADIIMKTVGLLYHAGLYLANFLSQFPGRS